MNKFHQTSVQRAEAIRLFHFIQQNVKEPKNILNASLLTQFFNKLFNNVSHTVVDFIHKIDKQGREMNEEYWGYCISELLQHIDVCTQMDINSIHYSIKLMIQGLNWKPSDRYSNWDRQVNETGEQKEANYQMVLKTCGELGIYINQKIDIVTFELLISKLNCCFSLITLNPTKSNEIIEIYQKLLTINIIQLLQYALTIDIEQNKLLDEFLKLLCYLYSGYNYPEIKQMLQRTFLTEMQTKWGLMRNIEDKRPDVRYFSSVLAALISHYDPSFSRHILSKNDYLTYMCKNIGYLSENDGLYYALQFLINIIKTFAEAEPSWQKQNRNIVSNIYSFGLAVLQSNCIHFQTLAGCLRLVSQCVKAIDLTDSELKSLKIVTNVFENQNSPLISTTLSIYKNVLIENHENSKQLLLGQKEFDHYFKKCLTTEYSKQHKHYPVLQIMLLLSSPQNSKCLFEKNLIQSIFHFQHFSNGTTMFFISQIILNLVLNSLDTEWMLLYLYEKGLLEAIGKLFAQIRATDEELLNHYPVDGGFCSLHKGVFSNCLKALFYLTVQIDDVRHRSTDMKKMELYKKNFTTRFMEDFEKGIKLYFDLPLQALKVNIREEQMMNIENNAKSLKMYKLISTVIEQMTIHLRGYFVDFIVLKRMNALRNEFHKKIYFLLSYNELQLERIPIYLYFEIGIEGEENMNVIKRVTRLNWQQLNYLLNQIVAKQKGFEAAFQIRQVYTNRMICSDGDYRNILEHVLHHFNQTNFKIFFKLYDIHRIQQNRQYGNSVRLEDMTRSRVEFPRFTSVRMPPNRDLSPYSSRRVMGRSQRQSPNFGSMCTECRRNVTSNASRICNECIKNSDFK